MTTCPQCGLPIYSPEADGDPDTDVYCDCMTDDEMDRLEQLQDANR